MIQRKNRVFGSNSKITGVFSFSLLSPLSSLLKVRNRNSGFSLIEILIGSLLLIVVLSVVYFVFVSGARQATEGTGKLQAFHRLRIVMEIIKDDLREAVEIENSVSDSFENELTYKKFRSSPILDVGSREIAPVIREVRYRFDPAEKRLTGTYGAGIELVNTTMFEEVGFRKFYLAGRPFVRMKFRVKRDDPREDGATITLFQTIGPRYLTSRASQKFWHRMPEAQPQDE